MATYWSGGVLAGVLPTYVLDEPTGPKLLPMGVGTTDYLDALGDGVASMLHALLARARAEGVPRCDLIDVPPGSALRLAAPPPGWSASWSDGSACPVLKLVDIPPGMRRRLRLSRNRAERAGGWTVEDATPGTLDSALDALVALHQARWESEGEPGVLSDPAVLAFHRSAAPGLLSAGLLRLPLLRVGGTVAAAALMLLDPGRIYFYLTGYDVRQRFVSPGTLLAGVILTRARAEGRTESHFLRGREAYKYEWGAVERLNADGHYAL